MKYLKILPLFIGILVFTACGKEETTPSSEKNEDSFQISLVEDPANLDQPTFKFSVPKDYSQLVIKEKIYHLDQEPIEGTVLTANLEQTTGEIIVEKETGDALTRFNFQVSSASQVTLGNPFPLSTEGLHVYGPNTATGQEAKKNFFAYKVNPAETEEGKIEFTNKIFEEPFNSTANLKEDELAVVWSYEFTKE